MSLKTVVSADTVTTSAASGTITLPDCSDFVAASVHVAISNWPAGNIDAVHYNEEYYYGISWWLNEVNPDGSLVSQEPVASGYSTVDTFSLVLVAPGQTTGPTATAGDTSQTFPALTGTTYQMSWTFLGFGGYTPLSTAPTDGQITVTLVGTAGCSINISGC